MCTVGLYVQRHPFSFFLPSFRQYACESPRLDKAGSRRHGAPTTPTRQSGNKHTNPAVGQGAGYVGRGLQGRGVWEKRGRSKAMGELSSQGGEERQSVCGVVGKHACLEVFFLLYVYHVMFLMYRE